MSTDTYMLCKRADDVSHDVVARRVGAIDAMRIVVESKPKRRSCTAAENYGNFGRIDRWLHPTEDLSIGPMLHATVALSDEYLADLDAAIVQIAEQFLRIAPEHWDGCIELDADCDERLAAAVRSGLARNALCGRPPHAGMLPRKGYPLTSGPQPGEFVSSE